MTDPAQGDPDAPTEPDETQTETPDLQAEIEKLKRESRKWEERAKANSAAAKERDELRAQNESDLERAVREAEERGRSGALESLSAERVADAFRVAAAGRDIDVDDLVDGINVAKFLGEDGAPDRAAVQSWVNKLAPEREAARPPDLGQGARGGAQAPGLNSSQLQRDLEQALGI